MTIKQALTSISLLNELNFRSLAELEHTVSDLKLATDVSFSTFKYDVEGLTTAGFRNTLKLQRSYKVLTDLHSKLKAADSIEGILSSQFRSVQGRNELSRILKSVRAGIAKKLEECDFYLNDLATRNFPQDQSQPIDYVTKDLLTRLNYKSKSIKNYVVFVDDKPTFCRYLCLRKVLNDKNVEHSQYFVTFMVTPNGSFVSLNSQFVMPHEMTGGYAYSGADQCIQKINEALNADSFAYANKKKKRNV